MTDPFYDVCEECGRHVVKAGHDPDCPEAGDEKRGNAAGSVSGP